MARDFEDFYDIENMTDEELAALVREELDEYPDLDASGLDIAARNGRVRVSGRIGTEAEYQQVEHILTDVLGVQTRNDIVIDELTRIEQPEAADDANLMVYARPRGRRGGADRTEDTSSHMLEDTGAEQFGTGDIGEAVERGYSWNPPDTPIQEGIENRENH